jgi:hypothetical protein
MEDGGLELGSKNPLFAKELLLKSPMAFFRNVWKTSLTCAKQVAMEVEDSISLDGP